MRNVNGSLIVEGYVLKERFYINYEECKFIFTASEWLPKIVFYINYEECKWIKHHLH